MVRKASMIDSRIILYDASLGGTPDTQGKLI